MIGPSPFALKFLCVTALFLSIPAFAPAQSPGTGSSTSQSLPVRDPQALATIQSAITATGGENAIAAIQDSTVQGTEQFVTDPNDSPASVQWQTSGAEFRYTAQNSEGTYTVVSGHGTPAELKNGNWSLISTFVTRAMIPFALPALALYTEVQNTNYSIQFVGASTANGKAAIHVHIEDDSTPVWQLVTGQEWYFDPSTYLPIRIEYKTIEETNPKNSLQSSIDFSNFQIVDSVAVPYTLEIQEGQYSFAVTVTSLVFNSGLPASNFDPPAGSIQ